MFENPELMQASVGLAKHAVTNSVSAVRERMKISKEKDNAEERIQVLEEIISNLIEDKNDLIQIAQVYDEQLVSQKISDEDIEYITKNIIPLFEKLLDSTNDDAKEEGKDAKKKQDLEVFKPLLSKETFNILQLIGFNYKKALGEPLTQLVSSMLESQKTITKDETIEYQKLMYKHDTEYYKMVNDKEASKRYERLQKRN